jgi:hypothetical protein
MEEYSVSAPITIEDCILLKLASSLRLIRDITDMDVYGGTYTFEILPIEEEYDQDWYTQKLIEFQALLFMFNVCSQNIQYVAQPSIDTIYMDSCTFYFERNMWTHHLIQDAHEIFEDDQENMIVNIDVDLNQPYVLIVLLCVNNNDISFLLGDIQDSNYVIPNINIQNLKPWDCFCICKYVCRYTIYDCVQYIQNIYTYVPTCNAESMLLPYMSQDDNRPYDWCSSFLSHTFNMNSFQDVEWDIISGTFIYGYPTLSNTMYQLCIHSMKVYAFVTSISPILNDDTLMPTVGNRKDKQRQYHQVNINGTIFYIPHEDLLYWQEKGKDFAFSIFESCIEYEHIFSGTPKINRKCNTIRVSRLICNSHFGTIDMDTIQYNEETTKNINFEERVQDSLLLVFSIIIEAIDTLYEVLSTQYTDIMVRNEGLLNFYRNYKSIKEYILTRIKEPFDLDVYQDIYDILSDKIPSLKKLGNHTFYALHIIIKESMLTIQKFKSFMEKDLQIFEVETANKEWLTLNYMEDLYISNTEDLPSICNLLIGKLREMVIQTFYDSYVFHSYFKCILTLLKKNNIEYDLRVDIPEYNTIVTKVLQQF